MSKMAEIHAGGELADRFRQTQEPPPQATGDQSAEIGELAKALSLAQGAMRGAVKDSKNPFFKSTYADLASVIEASRDALAKNGLCVIQTAKSGTTGVVRLVTTLAHSSGQWVKSELDVPLVKNDPQAMGSAITYGRRYCHAAIVGLAQVDDDAESAMQRTPKKVEISDDLKVAALDAAAAGLENLNSWFKAQTVEDRKALTSDPKWWGKVKDGAAA